MAKGQPQPNTDIAKVTVFDPENKLVAFSGTFVQGVREVVSQWGDIYILANDGKVRLWLFSLLRQADRLSLALTPSRKAYRREVGYAVQEIIIPHRAQPRQDTEFG
jgi:hypothetical protein